MPELPEVETVRRSLKSKIINKKIAKVTTSYEKVFAYPSYLEIENKIKNQTITDINRYGKWLIFELNDYYLLSHLRMEGKYVYRNINEPLGKHELVSFTLDDTSLVYKDVRKFGKMYLLNKEDLYSEISPLYKLGKEPWDKDLTIGYLKDKYKKSTKDIKTSLLDQTIITGIGNIYADEILFLSKISPFRKCNTLTDDEINSILKNTKIVLEKAIENKGTTIRSYTFEEGEKGHNQNNLYVHKRANEECLICKTKIIKTKINGRGTYYCNNCQK